MKIIIFILIILINSVYAENITLEITEFLPDPTGKDNAKLESREFIEIHNFGNNILSLDELKLKNNKNKSLEIFEYFKEIKPDEYMIIYPAKFFSLKNKGSDSVVIYYDNIYIDEVKYHESEEGYSWNKFNESWIMMKPTPGKSINYDKKNPKQNNPCEPYFNRNKAENTKDETFLNIAANKIIYQSKSLKQKRLGLYFFIVTLVFVILSIIIEYGRKQGDKGKSNC